MEFTVFSRIYTARNKSQRTLPRTDCFPDLIRANTIMMTLFVLLIHEYIIF
uniref:Uncharacterized protein n=1 Tax=Anguilla anguilla TaxID=7936 RepID=A0A0E9QYW6_ANGAN